MRLRGWLALAPQRAPEGAAVPLGASARGCGGPAPRHLPAPERMPGRRWVFVPRCVFVPRWMLALPWVLALTGALALPWPGAHAADRIEFNTARAVPDAGGGATRPQEVDFATARDVALPDNWLRTRPDFRGVVWYAVPLDAALAAVPAGAGEERVVLVPRVASRGEFWLNGERLLTGAGTGHTRNQALWLTLPAHSLKAAGNVLQVRVEGAGDVRDGLSALELGSAATLAPAYQWRRLVQTTVPLLLLLLVAAGGFAALPLWLKTRRRAHLMFLVLCACWLPRNAVVMRPDAGAPTEALLVLVLVTSLLGSALVGLLTIEFLGAQGRFWRNYRRAILGAVGLLSSIGAIWALAGQLTARTVIILHWPLFVFLVVALLAQVRAAFLNPRPLHVATALALTAWSVAALHDLALIADLTAFDGMLWTPAAIFCVFLSLIWRTIAGLALARGSADTEVNHAVSRALDEHGRALEQLRIEYDRKKADERNAVIAAERTRLLHDLHDGMGSQLITALRMTRREEVPRDEVARVIEDSLEDMRLIIDSLDLEERDLLPLLGNLRYRLEPRLQSIGITLIWDVEPLPELDYLTPETGLAVVRVVQEAVNNAVRHGGATGITVRARATQESVELSIADNGRGFDPERSFEPGASHRGLSAMRARAQKLGGTLEIGSGAGGTRVELRLPLRR